MHIKKPRQVPGDDFTTLALARLPDAHRVMMTGLRLLADVEGRGELDLHRIRRETWQAGEEGAHWPTIDDVETYLLELADAGFLHLYPDPEAPERELFEIRATWPKPQKQGYPVWPPPPDEPTPTPAPAGEDPSFRNAVVGGARAGERASGSESVGVGESGRESSSGNQPRSKLRLSPSRFCSSHPGGPLEGVDCRDCGTARLRQEEHKEIRAALAEARALPPLLRAPVIAQLEAKRQALEEAAARALLGEPEDEESPEEYVDEHGRIETT